MKSRSFKDALIIVFGLVFSLLFLAAICGGGYMFASVIFDGTEIIDDENTIVNYHFCDYIAAICNIDVMLVILSSCSKGAAFCL